MLLRLLATVVSLLLSTAAHTGTLTLHDANERVPLMGWTEVYVDDTRSQTVQDVNAHRDWFQPSALEAINFGFTEARVWLRFSIRNNLPVTQQRILYLRHFLFDEVVLHTVTDNGIHSQYSGREHLDQHNASPLPTRFFHFQLDIPPNTTRDYYLALTSEDALSSSLTLVSLEQFQRIMIIDAAAVTFYSALILTNLFFAVFMLVKLREVELLYYVGFLVFHHLIAIMMLEGVPASLLGFDNLFWNKTGFIFLINVAITMAVLFSRSFLKLKEKYPVDYLISRGLLVLMLVSCVQSLLLPHVIGSALTTVFCMIVGVGIMVTCVRCAAKHDRVAKLFLLSWTAGVTGATLYGLKLWNILPINGFTNHAWHIGTVVEAILFSFTIADRVTTERRMRLQAQTEQVEQERALRQAQEQLLQVETAAKIKLEQQVQERTKDITQIMAKLEFQNQQLTELSINDPLTQVRNRRFFNDAFPELWQEAQRAGGWLSIILLDIDHFKAVNDQYGHLTGDRCLVTLAANLRQWVSRPKDIICRYGGEEFIIVLHATDLASATQLAQRLRQAVSEIQIPLEDTTLHITASLGVAATIPQPGANPEQLIAICDHALYQAKSNGRNQVSVAGALQSRSLSSNR